MESNFEDHGNGILDPAHTSSLHYSNFEFNMRLNSVAYAATVLLGGGQIAQAISLDLTSEGKSSYSLW